MNIETFSGFLDENLGMKAEEYKMKQHECFIENNENIEAKMKKVARKRCSRVRQRWIYRDVMSLRA